MKHRFSFFRKLLILFLFGLLPLLALNFTLLRIAEFRYEKNKDNFIAAFKSELVAISQQASSDRFYFNLFTGLFSRLQSGKKAAEILPKFDYLLQRNFKSSFNHYSFDPNGELIKSKGTNQPNQFIIGKTWKILVETQDYQPGDENKLQKKLQILFGGECNAGFLKVREGQLIKLHKKGRQGYLFWKRFSAQAKSGLLIYQFPAIQTAQILAVAKRPGKISLDFWAKNEIEPTYSNSASQDGIFVKKLLENQISNFCEYKHKYWALARTNTGTFLGSIQKPAEKNLPHEKGLINLLSALIGVGLLILLLKPELNLHKIFISIKVKLVALVAIAIAIPVFGLIYTGTLSIEDQENLMVAEIENRQRRFLSAIENEFALEEEQFAQKCEQIFEKMFKNPTQQSLSEIAKKLLQTDQAIRVETRKIDGEIAVLVSQNGYFEGLEKTHDAFSRYGIKRHLAHRLDQEKIEIRKLPDSSITGIFESSDFGFSQILEAPGRRHYFKFGDNELLWYWRFIESPGHPLGLITIFQSRNLSRKNFLQSFIKNYPEKAFALGIFNATDRTWVKMPLAATKKAEALIEQAIVEEKSLLRKISDDGKSYLAVAMPGILLAPYNFVFMTSDSEVAAKTKNLNLLLQSGILLILLITMLVAQMLSQTFLIPVADISRSLSALQRRQADCKVQISSGDELGELGRAFNQMVDSLQEMHLAKIVQDSLFPCKHKAIPGYDLYLHNHTATELGGDYCDYFELEPDLWLILIGDVSGHGTPAALAMAMVKAAIFKACRDKVTFADLPETISNMLLTNLKRKKMMTMLFLLLNVRTHQLKFINAGHNWPLVTSPEADFREIRLSGMPLGIRRNKVAREAVDICLQENEGLLLYTDALIEGSNPETEPFGFERLYDLMNNSHGLSPEALVCKVEQTWRMHLAGAVQEDDLTILALQRKQVQK